MNCLFVANCSCLFEEEIQKQYASILPKARLERVLKMKKTEDRARSIGVWLLFVKALNQLHIEYDLTTYSEVSGKPSLSIPYHFSFSHSKDYVLVQISDDPCGCDIQELVPFDSKIATRFFTKQEQTWYLSSANKDLSFFKIWGIKESLLKQFGTNHSTKDFPLSFETQWSIQNKESISLYSNDELSGYMITSSYECKEPISLTWATLESGSF